MWTLEAKNHFETELKHILPGQANASVCHHLLDSRDLKACSKLNPQLFALMRRYHQTGRTLYIVYDTNGHASPIAVGTTQHSNIKQLR